MNRWILRGLTVAGFTAGAWLLGNAAAYAADTSADTTTTVTVEVHLGALTPSDVNTAAAPAVSLTVSAPVSTAVAAPPAVHAHTALAATSSTSTPAATDVGLGACVDLALDTAGSGCGQPTGTVGDSTAATSATAGTTMIDNSGGTGDANAVRSLGTGDAAAATGGGSDTTPADTAAGTTSPVAAGIPLASADTVQLDGSRAIASGPGTLPTTGSDLWWPMGIAAALLILGTALRRRAT